MPLSVVMAVRDGEPFIGEAIESVLSQSFADFEFLIVDDASTDMTRSIVASYARQDSRVRLLCNETNQGPYPSANRALREARGAFVARHDGDDLSPPDRFATQLATIKSSEDIALVIGHIEVFDRRQQLHIAEPPSWQPRLEWDLLFSNVVGAGAHVMFPRVFRGSPVLFPAKYRYAEDYGMWCSLSRRGRVACPSDVIYRYRRHPASISASKKAEQADCFSFMRHEYQTLYLHSLVTRDDCADLARLWTSYRIQALSGPADRIASLLSELTAGFLAYVELRYGRADREALARDIQKTLVDQLVHWLAQSIRGVDGRAWSKTRAISGHMGVRGTVSDELWQRIGAAVGRRLKLRASTIPKPSPQHQP